MYSNEFQKLSLRIRPHLSGIFYSIYKRAVGFEGGAERVGVDLADGERVLDRERHRASGRLSDTADRWLTGAQ